MVSALGARGWLHPPTPTPRRALSRRALSRRSLSVFMDLSNRHALRGGVQSCFGHVLYVCVGLMLSLLVWTLKVDMGIFLRKETLIKHNFTKVKFKHFFFFQINTMTASVTDAIEIQYQISSLGDPKDYHERRNLSFNPIASLNANEDHSQLFFVDLSKKHFYFVQPCNGKLATVTGK